MTDLFWTTERRKIKDLIPAEYNPRVLTPKQEKDLRRSLEKFNLAEIPAINSDNTILAGHQRVRVLNALGRTEEEIEVRVPNRLLTDAEAKEYSITSNHATGEWDWMKLGDFDKEMLKEIGFESKELDKILAEQPHEEDDEFDAGAVAESIKEPICKRGDIWQLGGKVICPHCSCEQTLT